MDLDVRPLATPAELAAMIDYFLGGGDAFLRGMGVDPAKLPDRETWLRGALADRARADEGCERFFVGWFAGGELVGHASLSDLRPGDSACAHLHLWRPELRRAGLGSELFARSLDLFFARFDLARIASEPYAANPAPRRTLARLGFRLVGRRKCVPSAIAFEQEVERWEIGRGEWAARRAGEAG